MDLSGVPALPADNTAFLGANLYGRHLVAVELAGVLLVVATLGAIAVAQKSGSGEAL
jgi:NADH:ubiquinone oxidoreductase subunit 6 (subunit J)